MKLPRDLRALCLLDFHQSLGERLEPLAPLIGLPFEASHTLAGGLDDEKERRHAVEWNGPPGDLDVYHLAVVRSHPPVSRTSRVGPLVQCSLHRDGILGREQVEIRHPEKRFRGVAELKRRRLVDREHAKRGPVQHPGGVRVARENRAELLFRARLRLRRRTQELPLQRHEKLLGERNLRCQAIRRELQCAPFT